MGWDQIPALNSGGPRVECVGRGPRTSKGGSNINRAEGSVRRTRRVAERDHKRVHISQYTSIYLKEPPTPPTLALVAGPSWSSLDMARAWARGPYLWSTKRASVAVVLWTPSLWTPSLQCPPTPHTPTPKAPLLPLILTTNLRPCQCPCQCQCQRMPMVR